MVLLLTAFLLLAATSTSRALHLPTTEQQRTRRQTFGDVVAAGGSMATAVWTSSTPAALAATDTMETKKTLRDSFPGAMPNDMLLERVGLKLIRSGFSKDTTLVASSLCSDEVNRPLEETFLNYYGNHFSMGGLAGFPFSGVTGFGAMASHIPDNGNCLLIYGPHVGVNRQGAVGTVERKGQQSSGSCCGSAVAASKYLKQVIEGNVDQMGPPMAALDAQQAYVSNMLLPYASEITFARDPMVVLPYATFKPVDGMINKIVAAACSKIGPTGKVALLGGVQINTPEGMSDYFLPLRFDVRDCTNQLLADDLLDIMV